jgi:steroid 5-alpha reductase family enzyme
MHILSMYPHPFVASLELALITVLILSVCWYIISLIRGRNDVADVGWATYFIAIAIVIYTTHGYTSDLRLIPVALVMFWGVRLSSHISARHARKGEDPRYLAWHQEWGNGLYFRVRSYLQVFLLQSIMALLISLPLVVMGTYGITSPVWLGIGTAVWILGFTLETIADRQLARYLRHATEPGICCKGLWGYSRHPNYFGEATQWWGIWIMSIGSSFFLLAILGPITITYLLRFVSGVPLAEKSMKRHPDFEDYQKTTSIFVPWFKKK